MLNLFILAFLAASAVIEQCHSFKQVKRKNALPIPKGNTRRFAHRHGNPRRRRRCRRGYHPPSTSASPLSIRGGNYGEKIEDAACDFIASFESDLAAIRREAELEAISEMQKLRGLIERREIVCDEDDMGPECRENLVQPREDQETINLGHDGMSTKKATDKNTRDTKKLMRNDATAVVSTVCEITEPADKKMTRACAAGGERTSRDELVEITTDSNDDSPTDNNLPRKIATEELDDGPGEAAMNSVGIGEKNQPVSHEEADTKNARESPDHVTIINIDQSNVESYEGENRAEEAISVDNEEDLELLKMDLSVEEFDDSESSIGSKKETVGLGSVSASVSNDTPDINYGGIDLEILDEIKLKKSQAKKKKKKSQKDSKKGKSKARKIFSEESFHVKGLELDPGEPLMSTGVQDADQRHQSGVWFYLRSDLGRALGLFIATALIAILTQRLQRQMEVEGI